MAESTQGQQLLAPPAPVVPPPAPAPRPTPTPTPAVTPLPVSGAPAPRPLVRRSPASGTARSSRPGRAPAAGYGSITRARCVAIGSLTTMLVSVVIIAATSGGSLPQPKLAPAASATGHPRTWTVQAGQTFSSIAAREGISLSEIERLNPKLIPNDLVAGQHVQLPS